MVGETSSPLTFEATGGGGGRNEAPARVRGDGGAVVLVVDETRPPPVFEATGGGGGRYEAPTRVWGERGVVVGGGG